MTPTIQISTVVDTQAVIKGQYFQQYTLISTIVDINKEFEIELSNGTC